MQDRESNLANISCKKIFFSQCASSTIQIISPVSNTKMEPTIPFMLSFRSGLIFGWFLSWCSSRGTSCQPLMMVMMMRTMSMMWSCWHPWKFCLVEHRYLLRHNLTQFSEFSKKIRISKDGLLVSKCFYNFWNHFTCYFSLFFIAKRLFANSEGVFCL